MRQQGKRVCRILPAQRLLHERENVGRVVLVTRSIVVGSGSVRTPVSLTNPVALSVPNITGGTNVSIVICNATLRSLKPVTFGVAGSMICTRAVILWMPSASVSVALLGVGPPWLPIVNR